jgi:hypothetical protein
MDTFAGEDGCLKGSFPADIHTCIWTVHKQDSKPSATGTRKHKALDPNHYPEFNSNVIPRLGTRRYRLYQVAAVRHVKSLPRYASMTESDWQRWLEKEAPIDASHLCRSAVPMLKVNPDFSTHEYHAHREHKWCFNPHHVILENAADNSNRVQCQGGVGCSHDPKCILVQSGLV